MSAQKPSWPSSVSLCHSSAAGAAVGPTLAPPPARVPAQLPLKIAASAKPRQRRRVRAAQIIAIRIGSVTGVQRFANRIGAEEKLVN